MEIVATAVRHCEGSSSVVFGWICTVKEYISSKIQIRCYYLNDDDDYSSWNRDSIGHTIQAPQEPHSQESAPVFLLARTVSTVYFEC